MSDMKECPIQGCDYRGSIEQVKGHWGGSQDKDHTGNFHQAYEAYQEESDGPEPQPDADNPREQSNPTMSTPTADSLDHDPEGCCSNPSLQDLPPGSSFTTDDGREGVTEPGDQYCKSCNSIVTADGEVIP